MDTTTATAAATGQTGWRTTMDIERNEISRECKIYSGYRCKSGSALPRPAVPGRVDASVNPFPLFVCRMWSCHFHILFSKQTICNSHVLVVCISDDSGQSLHMFFVAKAFYFYVYAWLRLLL